MKSNYISSTELCKKYNFNKIRLLNWIQKKYIKAKKVNAVIVHPTRGGIAKMKTKIWMVDEDSFLAIPAFIRKNYKVKS